MVMTNRCDSGLKAQQVHSPRQRLGTALPHTHRAESAKVLKRVVRTYQSVERQSDSLLLPLQGEVGDGMLTQGVATLALGYGQS